MSHAHLSGHIDQQTHFLPLRVYYEDTDFSGLVYHTSYLRWCERGRTEFVRLLGIHQKTLFEGGEGADDGGVFFVVRHMDLDFLSPALMDDVLEVQSTIAQVNKATIVIDQKIMREDKTLFKAEVTLVAVNKAGKPQRITGRVKELFEG